MENQNTKTIEVTNGDQILVVINAEDGTKQEVKLSPAALQQLVKWQKYETHFLRMITFSDSILQITESAIALGNVELLDSIQVIIGTYQELKSFQA